jgi:hypothetical protein
VEAQHVVSTMRLVDTPEEQRRLEMILDQAKPGIARPLEKLHFLLAAPFRYRPWPPGSRFREMAWWRWKGFLLDSPALAELPPVSFTLFPVGVADRAVDLREPPLAEDRATWTHKADYSGTQAFARTAREADVGLIVYESVRDPQHGANVAVMAPRAFRRFQSTRGQTWTLLVNRARAHWVRSEAVAFSFDASLW